MDPLGALVVNCVRLVALGVTCVVVVVVVVREVVIVVTRGVVVVVIRGVVVVVVIRGVVVVVVVGPLTGGPLVLGLYVGPPPEFPAGLGGGGGADLGACTAGLGAGAGAGAGFLLFCAPAVQANPSTKANIAAAEILLFALE
jgi:hypothetical protein